ncbi:hypothetical protein [Thalassotalea maritima]|uniref:hypothetical protein n=1 Tax=Thalassotalea maritima TaxID=3242416 RepID=UPI0035276E9A
MQFIKSLFCFHGHDNDHRFLSLSILSAITCVIANSWLIDSSWAKVLVIIATFAIYVCSALRRCRDAACKQGAALVASATLFLAFVSISFAESPVAYFSLLLPLLGTLYLFSQPSKQARPYLSGYHGPVDLSQFVQTIEVQQTVARERVEPSLFGENVVHDELTVDATPSTSSASKPPSSSVQPVLSQNDIGQRIHRFIGDNRLSVLAVTVVLSIVSVISMLSPLLTPPDTDVVQASDNLEKTSLITAPQPVIRRHLLAMPDNYYLLLNEHQGLVIHWKADRIDDSEVWSQLTGQGDDTCANIEFNKGDKLRTINVVSEDGGSYYATFSPLDSNQLIDLIARRGSFSLCAYEFSLKGSQKALSSHPEYYNLLN